MTETAEDVTQHESDHALRLTIIYNGIPKTIEINRDATVKTLLDRAIALFGNLPQPHTLALWTEKGAELTNEQETLKAAHIHERESLLLRPSAVRGG
jgi:hypothetical protein